MSINKEKATDTGAIYMLLKIKIKPMSEMMMMWPAAMFANKRIINANGLVRIPNTSIGIKIGQMAFGACGKKM